jgi:hypothetical protein
MQELKENKNIIQHLQRILKKHTKLSCEKKMKLYCYYLTKWARKKLLFYLNPRHNETVFGISHRGTDILEKHPILQSIADETKTSVMKFSIKKIEDIETKAISKIIELIMESNKIMT